MDGIIVKTPEINFHTLDNIKNMLPYYNQSQDIFYLTDEKPRPATSYDMDGLFWLRIDIETGEIVGLQIDNFESVFIKKHPELNKAWKQTKHLYIHKQKKSRQQNNELFLLIIIDFILSLFKNNPPQSSMRMLST